MLQSVSSVSVVYRRKTLTGSPDPTHANGTNKPCTLDHVVGRSGCVPGSQSPRYCNRQDAAEQLQFWFIQMKAGINTGGYQGLP